MPTRLSDKVSKLSHEASSPRGLAFQNCCSLTRLGLLSHLSHLRLARCHPFAVEPAFEAIKEIRSPLGVHLPAQ